MGKEVKEREEKRKWKKRRSPLLSHLIEFHLGNVAVGQVDLRHAVLVIIGSLGQVSLREGQLAVVVLVGESVGVVPGVVPPWGFMGVF